MLLNLLGFHNPANGSVSQYYIYPICTLQPIIQVPYIYTSVTGSVTYINYNTGTRALLDVMILTSIGKLLHNA